MSELMAAGIEITVIGMGVVFVLLTLLVFIVQGMSSLAHLIGGPPADRPAAADDAGTTAAITAAIHAYRARHKR